MSLAIVMYHYVRDLKKSKYPIIIGLELDLFREQIDYLRKNYSIVRMEDVLASFEGNGDLPRNAALLTFDDGYTDHYYNVMPYLKKHGLQGSFYIPSSCVLENKVLDVNKIHILLASIERTEDVVKEILAFVEKEKEHYGFEYDKGIYEDFSNVGYHKDTKDTKFIKQALQVRLPVELRKDILNHLMNDYLVLNEEEVSRELYVSQDQISDMANSGMHIGSHSHNHSWLGHMSKVDQKDELIKSKSFLEQLDINENQYTICYPYGSYNEETIDLASSLGFKLGLSAKVGIADNPKEAMFLPRLDTNDLPKDRCANTDLWLNKA